jgi:hypothetical protein
MIGLVLWHNPKAQVGMIWCEDQGPLAFLGPDVALPKAQRALSCGDQLVFTVEIRDGVRFVSRVEAVLPGVPGADPREILSGYHQALDPAPQAEPPALRRLA